LKVAGSRVRVDLREAQLDRLGDLVADHVDVGAITRLLDGGVPAGLPVIPPAVAPTPRPRS
jgi:adenosylcobyric acid synthase